MTAPASRTWLARAAWTFWALMPLAVLAYHFGPGQTLMGKAAAARVVEAARADEKIAEQLLDDAYAAHLRALEARAAASGKEDATLRAAADKASAEEAQAYARSEAQWQRVADNLQQAITALQPADASAARELRVDRARAVLRAGDIPGAMGDLEQVLTELADTKAESSTTAMRAREELGTAMYFGARVLRMSGKPADEWRPLAAGARQQFRYLAQHARDTNASPDSITNHDKNTELVLNLEQSGLDELLAKPRPRACPNGNGKLSTAKRPGRRPGDKPGNGAGMDGEIGQGW